MYQACHVTYKKAGQPEILGGQFKLIKTGDLKRRQPLRLAILRPFLVFFCQLHKYLSQNLGADGHFEVLHKSKY